MPELSSAVTQVLVHVEDDNEFGENAGHVAGGAGGDLAPPSVAFLAKKITGFLGRENTGRMYLVGVNEDDVHTNGTIEATKFENLQDGLNGFLSDLGAGGVGMFLNGGTSSVVSLQLEEMVATQRRRLR